jgi:hypothetical protein
MPKKKLTDYEILLEIYRRVYAVSEPPADFDQLIAEAETNDIGQKVIKYLDYECDDDVMKQICEKTLDEFKVKGWKRKQFFNSFWLGCSPKSKKRLP